MKMNIENNDPIMDKTAAEDQTVPEEENNVILAILKLSRALRRCAPHPAPSAGRGAGNPMPFPPAVGRVLACLAGNRDVTSRDLCEILDLRPSSLSEMLARAESEGWIIRTADEEDRRVQHIQLSAKGKALIEEMEAARKKDLEQKSACFTEEEKAQFCALCARLTRHLESITPPPPARQPQPGRPPRRPLPPEGILRC